jgi:hypothetical protein
VKPESMIVLPLMPYPEKEFPAGRRSRKLLILLTVCPLYPGN